MYDICMRCSSSMYLAMRMQCLLWSNFWFLFKERNTIMYTNKDNDTATGGRLVSYNLWTIPGLYVVRTFSSMTYLVMYNVYINRQSVYWEITIVYFIKCTIIIYFHFMPSGAVILIMFKLYGFRFYVSKCQRINNSEAESSISVLNQLY